jgi:Tol biopolymer transport system component
MATPRRLDPSDDSAGGFNDLDNSVVTAATLEHSCTPTSGSGCAVPDVWTVDADGSGQRKVLDSAFQPRWSSDGSKLLFQRYEANPDLATLGVYLAQSDGTGVRQLVRATLWGSPRAPPARSPTGRTILYGVGMVGAARLHLLSL